MAIISLVGLFICSHQLDKYIKSTDVALMIGASVCLAIILGLCLGLLLA